MNIQSEMPPQSSRRLTWTSVVLGVISIAPLILAILTITLERVFQVNLQWLHDFIAWLTATKIVPYLSLLSLPSLIIGIIARLRASTGMEKVISVLGVILGVLGIFWAYFIWSVISWNI